MTNPFKRFDFLHYSRRVLCLFSFSTCINHAASYSREWIKVVRNIIFFKRRVYAPGTSSKQRAKNNYLKNKMYKKKKIKIKPRAKHLWNIACITNKLFQDLAIRCFPKSQRLRELVRTRNLTKIVGSNIYKTFISNFNVFNTIKKRKGKKTFQDVWISSLTNHI